MAVIFGLGFKVNLLDLVNRYHPGSTKLDPTSAVMQTRRFHFSERLFSLTQVPGPWKVCLNFPLVNCLEGFGGFFCLFVFLG